MLLQKIEIGDLSFVIWEEDFGEFFWRCRSREDKSFFKSPPYRKWQRMLRDIHLHALRHRIASHEFPGIVVGFESDRILAHNQVAARIFRLSSRIREEEIDASAYCKNKQKIIEHKRELILKGSNVASLDLLVPGGLSLSVSTGDEIYELPGSELVIVTDVFELSLPSSVASRTI